MHNRVPVFIFVTSIVGLGCAFAYFQATRSGDYRAARAVLSQRSELRVGLTVRYERGPVEREEYSFSDLDGVSAARYRVLGRSGEQITIDERPRATLDADANVAFVFQQLVLDGIWDLRSKPPRGDTSTAYVVDVAQVAGDARGSRRIAFTDPHYWATTGGHQFRIELSRDKPVPDLLRLSSTTLVEPRYEKLVRDFRAFGAAGFRAKIAAAHERVAGRT